MAVSVVACDDAFSDAAVVESVLSEEVVWDEFRWLATVLELSISRLSFFASVVMG
jgi:hypothetical protein